MHYWTLHHQLWPSQPKAQCSDQEYTQILASPDSTSLKLVEDPLAMADTTIFYDTSTEVRPFVPAACRHMVFNSLHSFSHPGIQATQHLTARYVWPHVKRDVKTWTKACLQCQQQLYQQPSHCLMPILMPFTLILWVLSHLPKATYTSSLAWTGGQKPFLWSTSQQNQWLKHLFEDGSPDL